MSRDRTWLRTRSPTSNVSERVPKWIQPPNSSRWPRAKATWALVRPVPRFEEELKLLLVP
jgi:hypothetical protein